MELLNLRCARKVLSVFLWANAQGDLSTWWWVRAYMSVVVGCSYIIYAMFNKSEWLRVKKLVNVQAILDSNMQINDMLLPALRRKRRPGPDWLVDQPNPSRLERQESFFLVCYFAPDLRRVDICWDRRERKSRKFFLGGVIVSENNAKFNLIFMQFSRKQREILCTLCDFM